MIWKSIVASSLLASCCHKMQNHWINKVFSFRLFAYLCCQCGPTMKWIWELADCKLKMFGTQHRKCIQYSTEWWFANTIHTFKCTRIKRLSTSTKPFTHSLLVYRMAWSSLKIALFSFVVAAAVVRMPALEPIAANYYYCLCYCDCVPQRMAVAVLHSWRWCAKTNVDERNEMPFADTLIWKIPHPHLAHANSTKIV